MCSCCYQIRLSRGLFIRTAFFTLGLKYGPMTAAGTTVWEILWAKSCPFRNPLPQAWNFCGHLFCTKPASFAGYPTSPPWKSQPGKHLPSCTLTSSTEGHYDFIYLFRSYTALTFTLALLALASKTQFQSCKCELLSTHTLSTCNEFARALDSGLPCCHPSQRLPFSLNQFWKLNSISQQALL